MKNKSLIMLSVSVLLVCAFVSLVLADDANSTVTAVKNWTSICSNINERVADRIQAFDSGNVRRINSYNNTESMIQNLISKLNEKGADTTQAESDYSDLQAKVSQFNADYSSFITKLEGLIAFTCGNSSGQYAKALQDAKSLLPVLRNDALQVREAAMKIRIDLMQSRAELVAAKTGQRINRIQNMTVNIENRIANRTANMENRFQRLENQTNQTG